MKHLRVVWKQRLWLVIGPVRFYQLCLGRFLPRSCRFEPGCSRYCVEAVRRYGLVKGSCAAGWRILRCNPYCKGGHDPVENFAFFWKRQASASHNCGADFQPASSKRIGGSRTATRDSQEKDTIAP